MSGQCCWGNIHRETIEWLSPPQLLWPLLGPDLGLSLQHEGRLPPAEGGAARQPPSVDEEGRERLKNNSGDGVSSFACFFRSRFIIVAAALSCAHARSSYTKTHLLCWATFFFLAGCANPTMANLVRPVDEAINTVRIGAESPSDSASDTFSFLKRTLDALPYSLTRLTASCVKSINRVTHDS